MDFETEFSPSAEDFDTVTVTVNASNQGIWCSEYLFFASMSHYHLETYSKEGKHQVVFKNISVNDKLDI